MFFLYFPQNVYRKYVAILLHNIFYLLVYSTKNKTFPFNIIPILNTITSILQFLNNQRTRIVWSYIFRTHIWILKSCLNLDL